MNKKLFKVCVLVGAFFSVSEGMAFKDLGECQKNWQICSGRLYVCEMKPNVKVQQLSIDESTRLISEENDRLLRNCDQRCEKKVLIENLRKQVDDLRELARFRGVLLVGSGLLLSMAALGYAGYRLYKSDKQSKFLSEASRLMGKVKGKVLNDIPHLIGGMKDKFLSKTPHLIRKWVYKQEKNGTQKKETKSEEQPVQQKSVGPDIKKMKKSHAPEA